MPKCLVRAATRSCCRGRQPTWAPFARSLGRLHQLRLLCRLPVVDQLVDSLAGLGRRRVTTCSGRAPSPRFTSVASELCSLLRPLIVEPVFEVAAVDSPLAPELDSREGAVTELGGDDKRRYAHVFADIGDRQPLLGRVDGNSPHLAISTRSCRPSKGPTPADPRPGMRSSPSMLLTMGWPEGAPTRRPQDGPA